MNSDDVIKRLKIIAEGTIITFEIQAQIEHAIRHIQTQDRELAELKEDITDWSDKT